MDLLIGSGTRREGLFGAPWDDPVTLDINPDQKPHHVWDLNKRPLPFEDNAFDRIGAFEVLEHLGQQGDYRAWFDEWTEWWRILKPGGVLIGTSPHYTSPWAFMDPGHTRLMGPEQMTFLVQPEYNKQVGITPMSDYRFCYKADFDPVHLELDRGTGTFTFVMRAVKPSRCTL